MVGTGSNIENVCGLDHLTISVIIKVCVYSGLTQN